MKTPAFWSHKNIVSHALLPLSLLYGSVSQLRQICAFPASLPIPIICIGNLTAGGAGKTPVALAIGMRLREKHIPVFFLSRGYGGAFTGPILVDPAIHSAAQVGDEPLLLAGVLPTIVAKDRVQGARFAAAQGAKLLVMDDGYQNPSLAKTLSLLVIDGQTGIGNGRLLPAGPLRESLAAGLRRADAFIVVSPGNELAFLPKDRPVLTAHVEPVGADALRGKKVIAFCGIAYPQKFFTTLAALGAEVVQTFSFPDHYPYKHSDIETILHKAREQDSIVVTTAKDAVRLPPHCREQVTVVDVMLTFDNGAMLNELLDRALNEKN